MAESKVNRDNYIVLQGWMLTELELKGNELIVYACIYGFSQSEQQAFSGSLQYLADWTNSTKQSVINCLKSLVEKGYIDKTDKYINGVKFCEYRTTKLNGVLNKVEWGSQKSLMGGIKQSLPNNIALDKPNNNIDNIKYIVDHLNSVIGKSYKYQSALTQRHIKARLNEGFTVEDFKNVINKKAAEWKGTEMEQYLRPETLFGTKFESYLNATIKPRNGVAVDPNADDMLEGIF